MSSSQNQDPQFAKDNLNPQVPKITNQEVKIDPILLQSNYSLPELKPIKSDSNNYNLISP